VKIKKRYILCLLVAIIAAGIIGFRVFRKPGPIGPTPDEIVKEFLEFDRNGDGQLSQDELSERMQGLITRGDANQDGILSQDELHKLAQAQFDATQHAVNNEKRDGERQNQGSEK
jgi:Ca2+-binding EF-hand superfamily protein